jgi:hypothetical protein
LPTAVCSLVLGAWCFLKVIIDRKYLTVLVGESPERRTAFWPLATTGNKSQVRGRWVACVYLLLATCYLRLAFSVLSSQ